jgi:hypothetical protein
VSNGVSCATTSKMSEAKLVNEILIEFGARKNMRIWRVNTGAAKRPGGGLVRFGTPGDPDIMGILAPGGRTICIECKAEDGRLSAAQVRRLAMMREFGALVIVARTIEDVEQGLRDDGRQEG